MENKKKKDLAKIALAAFMLSASLPVAGHASSDAETQGTLLAGGGCGASSGNHPSSNGCGASSGRYSPATNGCGASTNRRTPASNGCGASQSYTNGPSTHGCGAASSGDETQPYSDSSKKNNRSKSVTMGDNTSRSGMNRPAGSMGSMDDSDSSSYQGTTTGPGPNDGYPATPRGSYNTSKPSGR